VMNTGRGVFITPRVAAGAQYLCAGCA